MRRIFVCLVLGFVCLRAAGAEELPAIVDYVASHRAPSPVASVPWDRYRGDLRRLPIGVFDSGIGGLTVLEAILKLDQHDNQTGKPGPDGVPDFAGERFVYLGDQANMPYGNYSSAGRVDFLRELIVRDLLFLLGDRYDEGQKPPVKAVVIACNTATAYGLTDLRAALQQWEVPIPVVGVVEAGCRGALDALRNDTQAGTAAVLATVGTCASGAYPRTLAQLAGQQGLRAPNVCQHGSPGLAAAIEGTAGSVDECLRSDIAALVHGYRDSGGARPISLVVLGCTHFPLVKDAMQREFDALRQNPVLAGLIAEPIAFIDPADYTAKELFRELFRRNLRLPPGEHSLADRDSFFITVGRHGPLADNYKYGRSPGNFGERDVRVIPLSADAASRSAVDVWRKLLPHVAEKLR